MRNKWIPRTLLICLLAWATDPAGWRQSAALAEISSGEPLVLPQMFNLNPQNGSLVILQNVSASQNDLNVEFFAQDGSFVELVPASLAGLGEAQVATPTGPGGAPFVGSVMIFGDNFTARGQWNFNVGGTPFFVGVPAVSANKAATIFQMPVGSVGANSMIGVAIENPNGDAINCTATYRDSSGQVEVTDPYDPIPGFGQTSRFAAGIAQGFEGSATIQCSGPALMTGVIQEQANGFPTPLFASPVL